MLKKILSLFLKPNCPLCQRAADNILCQFCRANLQQYRLNNCREYWQGDFPVFIWGNYDDYLKRTIAAFKYKGHQEIGEILGEWLAKAWLNSGLYSRNQKITVVPIPLHPIKQKDRGFNQVELIAKRFCQITKYNLQCNLVKRVRNTDAMFGLNRIQRAKNLDGAFSLAQDYPKFKSNSSVLIMDDIYTTGTTVNQVRQILLAHQIRVLGVAAMAKPVWKEK